MLDAFTATLEACDPTLGRFRSYRIDAGTDLLGAWIVEVNFGRIGSCGRTIRQTVRDEAEAVKIVGQHLRGRSTARKRTGVAYEIRYLHGTKFWMSRLAAID